MAIYTLTEWQVVPGKLQEMLKLEQAWLGLVRSNGGKPIGGFTTAVGDVNRIVALVAYDDWAKYGQAVQTVQQSPQFQQLTQASSGMFTDLRTSILNPTEGSPLK